ncbi:PepSY domain-containing protein [Agrobacterium tumefaciens]|uniref:PepSY domain-containing protein n=1 Tax=Agrobacterium tumefaciens TaxID=358 RepID=UPI001ADCE217|nr:PepSY domain-containing protein [Agrobacterium tumefaciens]QTK80572.1 PepSY domain-containing protein [Agrobacterium tumefaciens]
MKKTVFVALLLGSGALSAFAQQAPTANPGGDTPAVATPGVNNPTAPVEGANSFTEAQAKERMEQAGYTQVKDLKKDDKGVWMASGMKDGKAVTVALDYQGNVVAK